MVKNYIATASSFKIGDGEEIQNARLRIADTDLPGADMLLGSDFFVSHHIFVANSQRKLYLTYNGGPVFNLTKTISATTARTAEAPKTRRPRTKRQKMRRRGIRKPARRRRISKLIRMRSRAVAKPLRRSTISSTRSPTLEGSQTTAARAGVSLPACIDLPPQQRGFLGNSKYRSCAHAQSGFSAGLPASRGNPAAR